MSILRCLQRGFSCSSSKARQELVLPFGKHKGKPLSQVDDDYLRWIQTKMASKYWARLATKALQERNFQQMTGKKISVQDLLTDLKACSRTQDLKRGKEVHAEAVACGFDSNIYVLSTLVRMYAKCGSILDARRVFDSIQKPNVVSWTALLRGYVDNGEGLAALDTFSRMKASGCAPDSVTYLAALKACTSLAVDGDASGKKNCLERGREIHLEIGSNLDHYLQNTLIDMYTKCGSMVDARSVFNSMHKPDVVSWTALILGHAENGEGLDAFDMFSRMKASGCAPNSVTYLAAIKACTSVAVDRADGGKTNCLELGREIHSEIGTNSDHYVQNALIDMYAKCGSMVDARRVFDSIQKPDVVSWNGLLLGYVENREGLVALDMFSRMKASGCAPSSVTYVAALKACTPAAVDRDDSGKKSCLERVRDIHLEVGSNLDHYVRNTLIDMYAKCGSMVDARRVFNSMQKPDVVSWTALLRGYAENGEGLVALDMFSRMKASGCAPNSVTYAAALQACTSAAVDGDASEKESCLERGREIHLEIGSNLDHYLQNTLIDMYTKCGSMVDARRVFNNMQKPNVVSWTALLMGYAENGEGFVALDMFSRMKASGCAPDSLTYVAALKACTSLALDGDDGGKKNCLERGREIHSEIGSKLDPYIQNTLIDMYAKCGSMDEAHSVFDSMQRPDVVSWTTLLLGYAENGEGLLGLDLLSRMKASGCMPNSVTYMGALKACGLIGALALGRKLHAEITDISAHVVTCLVDFYAKCGSMVEAREVFDLHSKARAISTWNALLAGYGRFGDSDAVFDLFEKMQDKGFQPDSVTFVCMLSCCSHVGLVEKAREYFEAMDVRYGVTPTLMHYNCMVDVLGRANLLNEAVRLIQKMPYGPDAVTWMALLGACRKWKNVEIGRMAYQSLVGKDEKVASAHVLMAHLYSGKGMCDGQEGALDTRTKIGSWKLPGQAYFLNEMGKMVKFVAGEQGPPEVEEKMQQFLKDMKERGYVAEPYNMSCNASDDEKEKALCGHSERRAVVYGILKARSGEPIRVFKNMRMCDACHGLTKIISKLSGRDLMIRDASRFHVMVSGKCSCGDYW